MIIDIFAHHIPRSVNNLIKKSGYYESGEAPNKVIYHGQPLEMPYPANNADPEVRLKIMSENHIDIQVLSQTVPVLLGSSPTEAAEICSLSNDANYALCKAYPGKFVNICIMSLLDVAGAIRELNRSISELDCRGVTLASNQDGKGLDSPEYFPFYENLVKHELPVFLQPTNWWSYPLVHGDAMHVIGWPFDTTQAVWRLILGGVIDRFPTLKIVTHHCGAMLPYFGNRIEGTFRKKLPRPVSEYWDNIYGDTVLSGSVAACMCGYAFFGHERMMFGTDFPFGSDANVKNNLNAVKAMNIPPEHLQNILGNNAQKLLKIN